ncbi:hypothetical protein BEN74_04625 [Acinetobacter sp. WCHAc010034]|uniref:hypothetical protein n=1 Tax=Acinetobacter sp. WCHAc010034 TaxID=1879049 RepID=UPI00083A3EC2|nr:hypothetical protein [Acinetobacter sp. WCHAc010034]AYA02225.1 hypothetical protein BEN74_04625 [Acinetobacter sp. WCHAc010034]
MTMKQTQTKMFDFSDAGLDFCAGSKNLFPDRFKKMLAIGYNTKTVSGVGVTGNQVVLTYGVSHGYAAGRVLKLNANNLNGEYVIDSVTSNTVTLTIDNAPAMVSGGFTTFVAPLGWEIAYEQNNIQVYKFKHIDGTDRYARMCFQSNASHRNAIAVCIGKTFDQQTGFINDPNALQSTASVMSPSASYLPRWDGCTLGSDHNNFTHSEGYSIYGNAILIGSEYHLVLPICWGSQFPIEIYGILPIATHDYTVLEYPVLISKAQQSDTSSSGEEYYGNFYSTVGSGVAYVGRVGVVFQAGYTTSPYGLSSGEQSALSSILSAEIDTFSTTTAENIAIYERSSGQHLGYCYGAYKCKYSAGFVAPVISKTNLPMMTQDIDLESNIAICHSGSLNDKSRAFYMAVPIEEVKID